MGKDAAKNLDYIVATVLPSLALRANDAQQAREHFTYEEAKSLRFTGLPVVVNHKFEEEKFTVGKVVSSSVQGADVKVLMAVDPLASFESMFSSNAVADAYYLDVSLTHKWDETVRERVGSGGYEDVRTKELYEISIVRDGWRPGSRIEGVFLSEKSLHRLTMQTLRNYTARNRLSPPPLRAEGDETAFSAYIDSLRKEIENKLQKTVSSLDLSVPEDTAAASADFLHSLRETELASTYDRLMSSSGKNTVSASASAAGDDASRENSAAAAEGSSAPAGESSGTEAGSPAEGAGQRQEQDAGPSKVETVSEPDLTADDLMNKKVLAGKYVQAEREKSELRSQLEELAAFKAQYENERKAKHDEKVQKTRQVIDTYTQWMREKEQMSDAQIAEQAKRYSQQAQTDPDGIRHLLQPTIDLLVKASNEAQEYKRKAEALESKRNDESERNFFNNLAAQANSFRSAGSRPSSFSASSPPASPAPSSAAARAFMDRGAASSGSVSQFAQSGFASRFQTGAGGFEGGEQAGAKSGVVQASNQAAKERREGHSSSSSSSSSVAGSVDGGNGEDDAAWARNAFERSVRLAKGRVIPSYDEVARGGYTVRKTGRVQASNDGSGRMEEETEIALASDTPRGFSFAEFAPDVWSEFKRSGAKRAKVCRPLKSVGNGGADNVLMM